MEIHKPIFVIGSGRCGTTLVYNMLCRHPGVAWFSNYSNYFPADERIAALSRLAELPLPAFLRRNKYFPKPAEPYRVWNRGFRGFSRPFRDLKADDVSSHDKRQMRELIGKHMRYQGKDRFIGKYTGWSRIGFIGEIFPDSLFIHVIRDGRAVANSLLKTDYFEGWRGDHDWRWGSLPDDLRKRWEKSSKSFAVLAGLQWVLLTRDIEENGKKLGKDRFVQVKYEDVTSDPVTLLKGLAESCGLEPNEKYFRRLKSFSVRDMNYKWREDLTLDQQKKIEAALSPELKEKGYSVGDT